MGSFYNTVSAFIFVTVGSIALTSGIVHSQSADSSKPETRIEVDAEQDVIWFIINGQKKAVLRENGLHVKGDVFYTGAIRDVPEDIFDEKVNFDDEENE